ncbi:MAG: lysostaphin resistance A-like protein [Deltaproteobacteria bacterium]
MIDGHAESEGDARREPAGAEAPAGGRRVPPPAAPGREAAGAPPAAARPDAPASGAPPRSWPEAPAARPDPAPPLPPAPSDAGGGAWRPAAETGLTGVASARSGAAPEPGGGPRLRAAAPGQPLYLPQASWRWPQALAGLAIGAAPEALLSLAALIGGAGSSSSGAVSAGSAALLAVSALVLYGWQGLSAWLFSLRTAGRALALWGFRRPTRAILWTVPVGLVAVYAVSLAHDLVVHPEQQPIVNEFPRSGAGAALFVLVAVVMAPLFEEIVFRGFLFRGFANSWGWVWGALASSAVFGLAHLQLDVFVPLATLGFFLAWAYKKTGSLWSCIAMHGIFNAIAVLAWALTG